MAAFVDGEEGARPPAELVAWLRIQAWGDPWGAGWMRWPARWFAGVRLARNVLETWRQYTKSENRAKWKDAHPGSEGADTVNLVQELRRGQ